MGSYITIAAYLLAINTIVSAKINGGPRGRFDKKFHQTVTTNHYVSAQHSHFSYHPPSRIYFMCRYCHETATYPVYHGLPPTYVYKYRESPYRYNVLLTGLALYNLGRTASDHPAEHYFYMSRQNERCSLQVIDLENFEETKFPCFMMSSFMERSAKIQGSYSTSYDIASSHIDVRNFLQNGTTSPLKITRDQVCVVWHNVSLFKERQNMPCALLKEYADTMKPPGVPVYVWLPLTLVAVFVVSVLCQCLCKKTKDVKEVAPLNQTHVVGYRSNYD